MMDAIIFVQETASGWQLQELSPDGQPQCLLTDTTNANGIYCGTYDNGLWYSADGGQTWQQRGTEILYPTITALATSHIHDSEQTPLLWAGTRPGAIFCSEDNGLTWKERWHISPGANMPETPNAAAQINQHSIRWIEPTRENKDHLFMIIEQGGIRKSTDGGYSWERVSAVEELDGHVVKIHPHTPQHIYHTTGGSNPRFLPQFRLRIPPFHPRVIMRQGGYYESTDGGDNWQEQTAGLEQHHYLWSIAIDPADPNTMIAAAAIGFIQAHDPTFATSYLLRRTNNGPWQRSETGLPQARGSLIATVETTEAEPGTFYLASNHGLFRSQDAGLTWQHLTPQWPERYRKQHVQQMVIR
jgi:photosystem II stability/assembly factor-like uncharacterized protein